MPRRQIPCAKCDWMFDCDDALNAHWKEAEDHPYCVCCKLRCRSQTELEAHLRMEHPVCDDEEHGRRYFAHQAAFQRHCEVKHKTRFCVDCGVLTAHGDALREHYMESAMHAACTICEKGFRTHQALVAHYVAKSAKMHFSCALEPCMVIFDDAEGLHEHFRADARAHCFCEICDTKFGSTVALEQHERDSAAHVDTDAEVLPVKPSYCVPCDRQFGDAIALHQHRQSSHFFCFECLAYFESNKAIKQHFHWSSFAHKKRTLPCPKCEGKFKLVSSLLDHWVVKHIPEHGSRSQLQEAAISAGVAPAHTVESKSRAPEHASERHYDKAMGLYKCPACGPERTFEEIAYLEMHLASSVHERPAFTSPIKFKQGGTRTFRDLSHYASHLERHCATKEVFELKNKELKEFVKEVFSDILV